MPRSIGVAKGYFKGRRLGVEIIQMNPRLGATLAVVNGDGPSATPFASVFRGVLRVFR